MARPRSFDENQVLRIARDRFWSAGYAATSVEDILTATGLGKGSFYGAFGDKRKLFQRVFDDYCTGLIEVLRRELDGPDEGAFARLRAQIMAIADETAADTCLRGCLLAKGTAELSEHDPQITAIARRTFDAIEEMLTACVAAAQRAGEISPDADPARLAALLLAVLRGIEALGKAGGSPASLPRIAETALSLLPTHKTTAPAN
ncbi:TetR/AcrR family transcriptional regulator [Sphaerisporangium rhizosphaerae]|uniref:TetR/AcrR family transcriptional regulator n=1 Tax=Sphaerisporangium rhizosphaerae TaxID=2269375 RepID=A0ABW2PDX8_9ACTN